MTKEKSLVAEFEEFNNSAKLHVLTKFGTSVGDTKSEDFKIYQKLLASFIEVFLLFWRLFCQFLTFLLNAIVERDGWAPIMFPAVTS